MNAVERLAIAKQRSVLCRKLLQQVRGPSDRFERGERMP
jgi:hypothetical protein